jgi:16S rRNA (uracil1498-N3)-methyltransferase
LLFPLQLAIPSRPPRFYVARLAEAATGTLLRLPPDEARHATKTLRLRPGDKLELADGSGLLLLAEVAAVDGTSAMAQALQAPQKVSMHP